MSRTVGPHERNVASLRRLNAAECIVALRDGLASSVTELARVTGLSRPTIEVLLADLVEQDLVSVDAAPAVPKSAGGRPARRYQFRATTGYVAGVEAGVRDVRVLLADLTGNVVAEFSRAVEEDASPVDRIAHVRSAIDSALTQASIGKHSLSAVGIGVPAVVSADGRIAISPRVPGWTGVDVGARVGVALSCPVEVDQDVDLAALAEQRLGAGRLVDDLVYLTGAAPPAAAIVIGRQVHRGRHRAAGVLADLPALADRQGLDPHSSQDVASGIIALAAFVDPDMVVLGPEVCADASRLDSLRSRLSGDPRLPFPPKLVLSELGADAVSLGALLLAFDSAALHLYGTSAVPAPMITRASPAEATQPREAAPVALPAQRHTVLGLDADAAELRIGVVGVGARAPLATWANRRETHSRVVAVADPHPAARKRARKLFGSAVEVVDSHHDLISLDPHLDAVFVMSPDDTHAEIAIDLLRAGIPVYLEKPIATTVEDADRVLATARETGTRLYVGHNMRHMAVVTTMFDIIQRGEIGEVKAIWCRHFVGNGGDFYFKDWHADRRRSTSLLVQKGAHDIDVIHHLAGAYTEDVVGMGDLMIYGGIGDRRDNSDQLMSDWFSLDHWPPSSQTGLNPVVDVEDLSMITMRLGNGVLASYQQCHYTPDYWRNYTVIGTHGRLENFGDSDGGTIRVWNRRTSYSAEGDLAYRIAGDSAGHDDADERAVSEFLHFVRTGEQTATSPVGARYAVAAGILATDSVRSGSTPRQVPRLPTDLEQYFTDGQRARAAAHADAQ